MVGVHVENDCDGREKVQKRIAVFAAFENDRVALADAMPRAEQRQEAADHDRGVAVCLHENMRQHGGRRGLAVRAGNADGVFVGLHDIAPGLRPLKNGDALGAGSGDFGVVIVRCGRADEAVNSFNILGSVTDGNLNALGDQLIRRNRRVHVGTGDLHPHAPQDKAQRPHRHAADSDQMAALAGDQILLNMLTGRIFHARFLRKIWIAHARIGAYNEN